jgi:hypothetical protein
MLYGDLQKVMEGSEVLHGEFLLEDRYGVLQKCSLDAVRTISST